MPTVSEPPMTWIERERAAKWHRSMRRPLVLPERFADAVPTGIAVPALATVARRYTRAFAQEAALGIAPLFVGRARTFKTYTMCCLARWVYHYQGLEVAFIDAGAHFSATADDRFDVRVQAAHHELTTVPWLVVDDFTNVAPNTAAFQFMLNLATARFNACRPTAWTGNIAQGDITARYGPAFARRLQDTSAGYRAYLE